MLFNSYLFVLYFLPLVLIGYYTLNQFKKYNLAMFYLLCMSLFFYAYFNVSYLILILSSIVVNFGIYRLLLPLALNTEKNNLFKRKLLLLTGVLFNLSLLGYFKYTDFFIRNVNSIFSLDITTKNILLPLGISFFTFQQLSFVIDSYKGEVPKYDLLHYACFVTYFPQLIAGPIVTHDELVPQFKDIKRKSFDFNMFSPGLYLFAIGLGKKVILADTFGNFVNAGYIDVSVLDSSNALLVMLFYTLEIYFDFSGYCDMAAGIGKMMNIDLPCNFNSPYKSHTIVEFWERWHMTLTRFFTRYVYIPLGGNRKGNVRTYVNIMIVFALSGLWHGAGWNFVVWGLMHGILSVITRICAPLINRIPSVINMIFTFGFVNVAWIFFRAFGVGEAITVIKSILAFNFGPISRFGYTFSDGDIRTLLIYTAIAFFILFFPENAYNKAKAFKPGLLNALLSVALIIMSVLSFAGVSTFIYFNF